MTGETSDSRLSRDLGLRDAVVVGLGSMLGAGVFAALGPAAQAAGSALLVGLLIAAIVAYCNATSSAQLAAAYPESGGTYVYGRRRLGPLWGFLAGWAFVVGKIASCAAMALTFGAYAAPAVARPLAVAAVAGLTAVNYRGVRKTAGLTTAIVIVVLLALAAVVAGALTGGTASPRHLRSISDADPRGVLQAAGLLFFAFAGYARIATLGEEVRDPQRTIPRAIPLALGVTLGVYALVAVATLLAVGPERLGAAETPLAVALNQGRWAALTPVVRVGATVAALGVLLSLLVGVSRTVFAMAVNRDLFMPLAAVHPRHRVPHRAELLVATLVVAIVLVADVRGAIGFSSFAVLTYYAIANAAAWTQSGDERRWPRALQVAGVLGCGVLAFSLPAAAVAGGAGVLAAGAIWWWARRTFLRRLRRRDRPKRRSNPDGDVS
ncbi:MAG: amino acid permease [Nitriliruptorales bacterium]|nr:amino acid permease [Nitriliruptorales bacterium]